MSDADHEGESDAAQGMTREDFTRAFARDSADHADAVLSRRGDVLEGGDPTLRDFVPSVGFQATRERNVDSIMDTGLDPNRGGTGAAAAAANDPAFAGANFQARSQGQVHYTTDLDTVEFYSDYLTSNPPADDATATSTSTLGVNLEGTGHDRPSLEGLDLAGYEHGAMRDPDDPRQAFRTSDAIPPENIVDLGED